MLGHIVSKRGIFIDPTRVDAIQTINLPRNKKELQSFLGKINFLRRFVPNFVELVKHITCMLKKDAEIKWHEKARRSFAAIKLALTEAPVLISLDFEKEFFTFSYASNQTIAIVLLQKNNDGFEQPISFFSRALRDAELKYNLIEKQAYALVKSLKAFRIYIVHSKVIAFVPNIIVKDVLLQLDMEGKGGIWISKVLKFDIEINPTKLIKGKRLARLMAESNYKALELNVEGTSGEVNEYPNVFQYDWYKDIVYFLQNLDCPLEMEKSKRRAFKLKAIKYCIMEDSL